MANNQHFLKFRVENFKRFDEFEMDNLGQFNLIVGDNNVGKSSVLEALMFDRDCEEFLKKLYHVLCRLKHFDGLNDWFMNQLLKVQAKKNKHKIRFEAFYNDSSVFKVSLSMGSSGFHLWEGAELVPPSSAFVSRLSSRNYTNHNSDYASLSANVPYIPFQLSYSHQMTDFYARNIQLDKRRKQELLEDLQTIIPDIQNLEINTIVALEPVILVTRERIDANLPLGTYGDGVVKLFRILIEMQIHAGKRLMIDEIDTGIHFSRMKLFWKTVIRSARNNDVQLFATTHSDECIACFAQALEEEAEDIRNDSRIIHLEELDAATQVVKAYTYGFKEFDHALDIGNELR